MHALDECLCQTGRSEGPQPPPPPPPLSRVQPYNWVPPLLDVDRDAVFAAGAAAGPIDAGEAAAAVIRSHNRLKCMEEMNETFQEQEGVIRQMGAEIAILRQELRTVKARRYDLCSGCGRKLI